MLKIKAKGRAEILPRMREQNVPYWKCLAWTLSMNKTVVVICKCQILDYKLCML